MFRPRHDGTMCLNDNHHTNFIKAAYMFVSEYEFYKKFLIFFLVFDILFIQTCGPCQGSVFLQKVKADVS